MNKIWIIPAMVFSLIVAMSSFAFATVLNTGMLYENDVALGGITLGMTKSAVAVIDHGYVRSEGARLVTWKYGGTFSIEFSDAYVNSVKTTANNGIQTPSGIHVGSSVNDVWRSYGKPWMIRHDNGARTYWYHTMEDRKFFIEIRDDTVTRITMAYE